jgi:formylmethanofuran dehydrogenase subunit E
MSVLVKCQACKIPLDPEDQRVVGTWTFCAVCLEGFLTKPANVGPQPTPLVAARPENLTETKSAVVAPPAVALLESYQCCICDETFTGKPHKQISSASVCADCYGGLIPKLEAKPNPALRPSKPSQRPPPNSMSNQEIQMREEMSTSPAHQPLSCAGCNKRLPGLGAAKALDGALYCPDCHHKLSLVQSKPVLTTERVEPEFPSTKAGAGDFVCDCCERAVLREAIEQFNGLMICHACQAFDHEAALRIAGARHESIFDQQRSRYKDS